MEGKFTSSSQDKLALSQRNGFHATVYDVRRDPSIKNKDVIRTNEKKFPFVGGSNYKGQWVGDKKHGFGIETNTGSQAKRHILHTRTRASAYISISLYVYLFVLFTIFHSRLLHQTTQNTRASGQKESITAEEPCGSRWGETQSTHATMWENGTRET